MRIIYSAVFFLLCFSTSAQDTTYQKADTSIIINGDTSLTVVGKHGNLINDDLQYNPKAPAWAVSAKVLSSNIFNWALNKYYFKATWPSNGIEDWKRNFQRSPEWDYDGFGINFIGHPHTGSYYFNAARANGYGFWQSLPFTIQGSVMWEWLGENERPSYNDLINTPLSGMFLGEVFYRITSNILDDRKSGFERVLRESISAAINPTRALNRLTSGKMFRLTNKEVYQKEPLNLTFSTGFNRVNEGLNKRHEYATAQSNIILQMLMNYGDPYETRDRKPFDYFRLRVELGRGDDKKLIDNVMGFGLLKGKTRQERSLSGIFQHFDYWRYNEVFEVASMGFGLGALNKVPLGRKGAFNSSLHLALVPLAGNNNAFLPDTEEARAYNFGGGVQSKIESELNVANRIAFGFRTYHYFIKTYSGTSGNSLVGIIKPSLTLRLFKGMHIGAEHHIYHNDRYQPQKEKFHLTRTEQKYFLQWKINQY